MPLPQDERVVALANDLLKQFQTIFGVHPGLRPAHAKGQMFTGTFKPASGAATLSRAPHLYAGIDACDSPLLQLNGNSCAAR